MGRSSGCASEVWSGDFGSVGVRMGAGGRAVMAMLGRVVNSGVLRDREFSPGAAWVDVGALIVLTLMC